MTSEKAQQAAQPSNELIVRLVDAVRDNRTDPWNAVRDVLASSPAPQAEPSKAQQAAQPSAEGPAELWLQLHGDCDPSDLTEPVDYTSDDVTWCWHRIHDTDVRYVRADLAATPSQAVAAWPVLYAILRPAVATGDKAVRHHTERLCEVLVGEQRRMVRELLDRGQPAEPPARVVHATPSQPTEAVQAVTTVDGGALTMALNVLRRAGKSEVADALEATAARASPVTTPSPAEDGRDAALKLALEALRLCRKALDPYTGINVDAALADAHAEEAIDAAMLAEKGGAA